MDATPLCPAPVELRLDRIVFTTGVLVVTAAACRHVVACPLCGQAATRVHSRYRRRLGDLPWHGLRVRLEVTVRKFFCDMPGCHRRVFAERLPLTAAAYARRTERAAAALQAIGFAVGGRPGARLAQALGLTASAASIVARMRSSAEPDTGTVAAVAPRVLGVDDWAMRRSQRYGTLLLDLERRAVIDVLPDRDAATFAAWLRAHPGVQIVSRDRGGAYAEAVRAAAPDAIQVADRFHLLRNLTEALSRSCTRHHRELRALSLELTGPPCPRETWRRRRVSGLPSNQAGPPRYEQRIVANRARRLAKYDEVIALHERGTSNLAIGDALHLDHRTVATWLEAGSFPERRSRTMPQRGTLLDRFREYVEQRRAAGVDNAAALYRELLRRGYRGSEMTVRRALTALRKRHAQSLASAPDATREADSPLPTVAWPAGTPVPTPRHAVWLLRKPDDALRPDEQDYVELLCAHVPALAEARRLTLAFAHILKTRDANALQPWLTAAYRSELQSFARGIERDRDAVLAAILFQWSNGQVEGHVHRLKAIKRARYGRANFDLLRTRVLQRAS
jgi:transposase